jgi:class III lanthionine synthetase
MRKDRWVDRFEFAWKDGLFFTGLDGYTPEPEHFISWLPPETREHFKRMGIWWMYPSEQAPPRQGWKIHLSAHPGDLDDIVKLSLPYLIGRDLAFKVALDRRVYEHLNSKTMNRGNSGKLVTIYPRDDQAFREILEDLSVLLDGRSGPYVLSDLRYKDSAAIYFRYGQFVNMYEVDVMGRPMPFIEGPHGPVSDARKPYFNPPTWVEWPFSDWNPTDRAGTAGRLVLADRFEINEAIKFSNAGGVYKAKDLATGEVVIVKEARPGANGSTRVQRDAIALLGREWEFLKVFEDTDRVPTPVARFSQWEHEYIAESFIEGKDIRVLFLENTPLLQPEFKAADSRRFLAMFIDMFASLARFICIAHERGVILGDLTAGNLIVDPESLEVTIVDLESCRLAEPEANRIHLHHDVELFTPGFSHARRLNSAADFADDLYSLAIMMGYFIFPIASMSFLRKEIIDLYEFYTKRLSWPSEIHNLMISLADGSATIETVLTTLEDRDRLLTLVTDPNLDSPAEDPSELIRVRNGLVKFLSKAGSTDLESLFPVDPFAQVTNPLSLGFGASGILYAMHRAGAPQNEAWLAWLADALKNMRQENYPPGLLNGLSGIAWAALDLGLQNQAEELLRLSNQRAADETDYTMYYGLAGIGMTNIRFYFKTGDQRWLAEARVMADRLLTAAVTDSGKTYWTNGFTASRPFTGLGFGQAGVSLFLLRMTQIVGDTRYRDVGDAALDWEMANATDALGRVRFVDDTGTIEPYLEIGSAGVFQVLLRYGRLDEAKAVVDELRSHISVLAGYLFGAAGVMEAFLDGSTWLDDPSLRQEAVDVFDYVKRVFLFTPDPRHGLVGDPGDQILALPGEGLLRCTCDVATGSAGMLMVVNRLLGGAGLDLLLDELDVTQDLVRPSVNG